MPQEPLSSRFSRRLVEAVDRYEKFFHDAPSSNRSQDFGAYQSACRAALSHIELLLKLIRRVDENDGMSAPPAGGPAQDLIARAEAAVGHAPTDSP